MQQPHDRFFRHVFSDPENARGELEEILPREVGARLDWTTLRHEPASYIEPALKEKRTDVLFSVELRSGQHVFLYLLLEHQSSVEPFMALRLLGYMVRIWEKHLAALHAILRYILEVTESTPERVQELARAIGPKAEETLMTGEQILIARGEAKGKAEGKTEGKAEGILLVLSTRKVPINDTERERILACKDIATLDRWLERAVTTNAASDLFAD